MKYETLSIDELSLLIPRESDALAAFRILSEETLEHLGKAGRWFYFAPDPAGVGNILAYPENCEFLPESIISRWRDWYSQYQSIVDRNPQVALYGMLQHIAEVESFSSWPSPFLEIDSQDWVDSGIFRPLPFEERGGIITREFFDQLRAVRAKCGGWLYHDGQNVRFAPEAEWQRLRSARDWRPNSPTPR